jgi:hypothetical protein
MSLWSTRQSLQDPLRCFIAAGAKWIEILLNGLLIVYVYATTVGFLYGVLWHRL